MGGENNMSMVGNLSVWWLIPAWAGKTKTPLKNQHTIQAHPRVGGENHILR